MKWETLKLIAKQWYNLSDLMKLAGVVRNNPLVIKSTIKKKQSYFGLIMPDNTMDHEFHQNDCIILREQNKMTKDGFYCVMKKGQDIITIRKLITINDGIKVMPLNLGYDFIPTTYLKGTIEYENFKIIGYIVKVKRYYD